MALLSRERFLAEVERKRETVQIPELGGEVIVQGLGAREWIEMMSDRPELWEGAGRRQSLKMSTYQPWLVAHCCVDEQGQRIFSDEDVALVERLPIGVVSRLCRVAQRVCGVESGETDGVGSSTPAAPSPSA